MILFFRFRIDNTDHIIDVNLHQSGKTLRDYDQINIICPTYNQNRISDKSIIERFIIYHVTKEEYDSCRILHPRPRIIAQCKSPFRKLFFTISFRSFSPTPGALEFKPGFDYHFISTSSKEDVNQLEFGMCHTNNMKIVFKIAENVENKPNNLYLNTKRKSYKSDKSNFNNGSFDLMKSKKKFPKSSDYYLYPNKLDVNQDKGVFKQEASTSKASAFTCFNELSLKYQISFLLYFVLIVL